MATASHDGNGHPGRPLVPAPPEVLPSRWVTGLLSLLTLTWVLAFAPSPWALATVPAVVGWLAVIERSRSFREVLGWLVAFGAVATVIGYRWLADTIQAFGDVPATWSWLLTALFGVWGTAHGWVFAVFYRSMLRRGRRPHPLVTAALIAACETLPIRLFAWSTGHGVVGVPPLAQMAEWGGVPLVSFATLCLVVPVYEAVRAAFVSTGPPPQWRAIVLTFGLGLAGFGAGLVRYAEVRDLEATAPRTLRVAIVQANVGSTAKREAEQERGQRRRDSMAAYRRGTERAAAAGADVVVWPETAITDAIPLKDAQQTNEYLRRLGYGFLVDSGADRAFLVGLYEEVTGRRSLASGKLLASRYNVAALRQPGDQAAGWTGYRKVHLIPFGETMPFGLYEDRLPQNFKMLAGELPQPLLRHGTLDVTFAPFLCYEGILADYVRESVAGRRPDVLVSLTNDSWFGDSWEPYQHLNFTRFRAIEHRAPLVRATNTGISAFVSATGDVLESLGVGEEGVLVREVPLFDGEPTLYVRLGHRLPILLWIVALAGWLVAILRPPPLLLGRDRA